MRLTPMVACCALGHALVAASAFYAQEGPPAAATREIEELRRQVESQSFVPQQLQNKVDDVWFDRVGDVAEIDKVYIPTVPAPKQEETYGIANARHPFRMWSYVFVPKGTDRARKLPLLVVPHGGVHGDFTTYRTHIVRGLMTEGYVVLAPEYRGSTGYGREYWEAIPVVGPWGSGSPQRARNRRMVSRCAAQMESGMRAPKRS